MAHPDAPKPRMLRGDEADLYRTHNAALRAVVRRSVFGPNEVVERRFTGVAFGDVPGGADGDGAQPRKDGVPVGLVAHQLQPEPRQEHGDH